MPLSANELSSLRDRGWVALERSHSQGELASTLLECATSLGVPRGTRGELVDYLTIRTSTARPSLTRQYGLGAFPFHTDTAVWPTPARYVALACLDPGHDSRPTRLSDSESFEISDVEHRQILRAVFLVQNGKKSFLTTVRSRDRPFIRFDAACMQPKTPEAVAVAAGLPLYATSHSVDIHWTVGKLLFIDNWRILHARSDGEPSSRALLRTYIE